MRLHEQRFELSSASIGDVRRWARDRCSECDAGDHIDVDKVEIALGEVLQNIIRYAYEGPGIVDVRVCDLEECVAVTVHDHAPPKPADEWDKKSSGADGGFGLSFIEQCSDAYRFRAIDSGNRFSLYFFVDPSDLSFEAMLWAGELLEARVASESMFDWCRWSLSTLLADTELSVLKMAIEAIESFERSNDHVPAYHNVEHFRDVLVTACHFIERSESSLSSEQIMALALTAILHDYGHPGRAAYYPGEIEERTERLVLNLCESHKLDVSTERWQLCVKLIRSTSPISGPPNDKLSQLFHACDVGASLLPTLGEKLSAAVAKELRIGNPFTIRCKFLRSLVVNEFFSGPVLGGWRERAER